MRMSLFQLLLVGGFALSASAGSGQGILERRISLSETGQTLKRVLHNIEQAAGVKFTYDSRLVAGQGRVDVEAKNEDLKNVLNGLLNPLSIRYEVVNDQIILKKVEVRAPYDPSVFQKPLLKGIVTDKNGAPVAGANVMVQGTKRGTVTDVQGRFEIDAKEGDVLIISEVGYANAKTIVGKETEIAVKMEEGKSEIGEVVVTALGIKRSTRSIGFSEEQIGGGELTKSNAPNVVNALEGKMAGVNITQSNGVDGGSTRIIIGGNNSINGDNQPLIVVDGMPMDNSFSSAADDVTQPKDWGSAINLMNPEDIEDMSVLKGPAAAALYGGRGANGVILITTKKGTRRQGLGVDYNFTGKVVQPYRYIKMQNEYGAGGMVSLNAPQYQTDGSGNPILTDGWTQLFVDQKTGTGPYGIDTWNQVSWPGTGVSWGHKMDGTMIKWWDGVERPDNPQPNNIKEYYRNGYQTTHNVSVSGGNEFGTLRASYTRLDNTSIIPNSGYNQNTFNLGATAKLTQKVNVVFNVAYITNMYHNAPQLGNNEAGSYQSNLIYAYGRDYRGKADNGNYQLPDGSQNKYTVNGVEIPWFGNGSAQYVYWNTYMNNEWVTRNKLIGTAQVNYDATSFLNFMFRASIDANNNQDETINAATDPTGTLGGTYANGLTRDVASNYDWLVTLHKDNIRSSGLNAKFSVGGTAYKRSLYGISGTTNGRQYDYSGLSFLGNYIGTTQPGQIPSEQWLDKKLNSLYGFLNLSYKSYLYLDITARNDWSSTLPSNDWSYFFPSASASWIFTDALNWHPSWLSFGKLRAAWAQGALDVAPYQINQTFTSGTFAGAPTTSLPQSIPAVNYKPQVNTTADFGVVLGALDNRINLDVRYYHGKSVDQVLPVSIPQSSGATSTVISTGALQNSGIEAIVRATPVKTRHFTWDISVNMSKNFNKLLYLTSGVDRYDMNNIWGASGTYISAVVGKEFGAIMGYDYVYDPKSHQRLLQSAQDIQANYPYVDAATAQQMKGTLYQATSSIVPIGNAQPKWRGGMTNTFTFGGGFSISTLIDWKIGGQMWSGTYASMMQQGLAPETLKERDGGGLAYTTPDGTATKWGVILPGYYSDGTQNTTVVHYYYKYMQYGVWSSGPNNSQWVHSTGVLNDTWYKFRELSVSYAIPSRIVRRTHAFQGATVSLVGRDLFYIYSSLPDRINPEGMNGAGNAQGIEFASLPGTRSFGAQVRLSF
ncbi:MAG TPA: SusC/RagA family TonB-linked outer membrane protein [Dinghuibacter sp.]|uniref:SusC/RagA family TonB-linked outer membrane protein n=1 Tax=Dinghuibacter sp. TaxID=2024697 RepID=UPI002C1AF14F|nr:SusC/RagA family TonB-linked outer membrane protein [Dinghuibacter sp.]HTJ12952.1 SusC/RagA family TonB-linked outer membrane protein [Dinghuibacter sp.]